MCLFRILGVGLLCISSAIGQPLPIGNDAVWQPGNNFVPSMHAHCRNLAFPALGRCFADQMAAVGASPAAVRFAHRIDDQGYLRAFRAPGRVDIAYADYVFAANENQHVLLVNGMPPIIDVDDFRLIDRQQLRQNQVYRSLQKRYPRIALWPGDRFSARFPRAIRRADGGQRFVVRYRLQDFCHACVVVGMADFAFDFDRAGRFLGTRLVQVEAGGARGR
jgi:hypothetical protein